MRESSFGHENRGTALTAEYSVPARAYLSVKGQSPIQPYQEIENGNSPFRITEGNACLGSHS
jgi:hypothetical protein